MARKADVKGGNATVGDTYDVSQLLINKYLNYYGWIGDAGLALKTARHAARQWPSQQVTRGNAPVDTSAHGLASKIACE